MMYMYCRNQTCNLEFVSYISVTSARFELAFFLIVLVCQNRIQVGPLLRTRFLLKFNMMVE